MAQRPTLTLTPRSSRWVTWAWKQTRPMEAWSAWWMRKPREWPSPVPGGGLLSVAVTLRPHAPHPSCSPRPLTHQRLSCQRSGKLEGAAGTDKHREGRRTMPARVCRHGPAFWGHAFAVGLSGTWVSAQPLASGAWMHQRRPALGRDHQLLWPQLWVTRVGGE